MSIADLIPEKLRPVVNKVLDLVSALMQGETVLFIGNSAAVVIYVVAKVFGAIPDVPFEVALAQASAAIVVLNVILLRIRALVYSAKTVAAIVTSPPAAAGPVAAAVDAGVAPETIAAADPAVADEADAEAAADNEDDGA